VRVVRLCRQTDEQHAPPHPGSPGTSPSVVSRPENSPETQDECESDPCSSREIDPGRHREHARFSGITRLSPVFSISLNADSNSKFIQSRCSPKSGNVVVFSFFIFCSVRMIRAVYPLSLPYFRSRKKGNAGTGMDRTAYLFFFGSLATGKSAFTEEYESVVALRSTSASCEGFGSCVANRCGSVRSNR